MGLNIQDLTDYEKKLTAIIDHTTKERDAIRLLIAGIRMRTESNSGTAPQQVSQDKSGKPTILDAIRTCIDKAGGEWITTSDALNYIIGSGIRNEKMRNSLRATVSGKLRKLYEAGELERENIGENSKKFQYRKRPTTLQ